MSDLYRSISPVVGDPTKGSALWCMCCAVGPLSVSPRRVRWPADGSAPSGGGRYVCHLEQAVIEACGQLGVQAATSPHTGVWVGDNKICALGEAAS